jgi:DNA-directed RNA polymerase specialized sigma24 family protein
MDHAGLLDFAQAEEASPEQAVLQAEQARLDAQSARRLWRAFSELSARCQQLLRVLIATPPRTYAEVAAALGLPVGSIGPIRARCLQQLRLRLAGEVSETM